MEQRLSAVEQSIARIDAVLPTLATKAELVELRGDMGKGFADARADFQTLRADFQKNQNDQIRWMIATALAGAGLIIGFMKILDHGPAPSPQPAPPVTINIPAQPAPVAPAPSPPAKP